MNKKPILLSTLYALLFCFSMESFAQDTLLLDSTVTFAVTPSAMGQDTSVKAQETYRYDDQNRLIEKTEYVLDDQAKMQPKTQSVIEYEGDVTTTTTYTSEEGQWIAGRRTTIKENDSERIETVDDWHTIVEVWVPNRKVTQFFGPFGLETYIYELWDGAQYNTLVSSQSTFDNLGRVETTIEKSNNSIFKSEHTYLGTEDLLLADTTFILVGNSYEYLDAVNHLYDAETKLNSHSYALEYTAASETWDSVLVIEYSHDNLGNTIRSAFHRFRDGQRYISSLNLTDFAGTNQYRTYDGFQYDSEADSLLPFLSITVMYDDEERNVQQIYERFGDFSLKIETQRHYYQDELLSFFQERVFENGTLEDTYDYDLYYYNNDLTLAATDITPTVANVFPNPAGNMVIVSDAKQGITSYRWYDLTGRLLQEGTYSGSHISLPNAGTSGTALVLLLSDRSGRAVQVARVLRH